MRRWLEVSGMGQLGDAVSVIALQVYDVMVEYNNQFLCSIWTPPFRQAPFKSLINFSAFSQVLSMGSRVALRTSCINSINKLRGATILRSICLNSQMY